MNVTKAFARVCHQKDQRPKHNAERRGFLLQWHVNDQCNLKCKHCYQEGQTTQMPSFDVLLNILRQYDDLLNSFPRNAGTGRRAHINLTGGEPFLHPHFFDLLELLCTDHFVSYGILSNGTLVTPHTAKRLKALRPAFVQVSIEGTRETHDQIRGEGSYQKAMEGINNLVAAGIATYISFTAHRRNYLEFPDVVRQGRKLGISRIWADRLIPCGNGAALMDDLLDQNETAAFFGIMETSRKKRWPFLSKKNDVAMHRALQFLAGGGEPYHCTAGNTLISILPNGDVLPCRRMPVVVGNVFEKPLKEIYAEHSFLKLLRDETTVSHGCEQCMYNQFCRGGLRCLSQAVNGTPFQADPGCLLSMNQKLNEAGLTNEGV